MLAWSEEHQTSGDGWNSVNADENELFFAGHFTVPFPKRLSP